MRITKLWLICICCVMVGTAVWGQAANGPAKPGILGYLDPHTGAFRAVSPAVEEGPDAAAITTLGGTVDLTITITLKTRGLTNITCLEGVSVIDGTTSPRVFDETNTAAAIGTGNTRTCKLSIPYSWGLTTQSTDTISTSYSVSSSNGTSGLPQRTSELAPLDTRKVPANGTITTLTASVTL